MILQDLCKIGSLDLETVEMAMRAAMHQAGALALSQLLRSLPAWTSAKFLGLAATKPATARCGPGEC